MPAYFSLRLEDLPFPDNYFDLVRTVHTEYCIPEDKVGMAYKTKTDSVNGTSSGVDYLR